MNRVMIAGLAAVLSLGACTPTDGFPPSLVGDGDAPTSNPFVIAKGAYQPEVTLSWLLTQSPNDRQIVQLGCGVEINLTGQEEIHVDRVGIELIAEPGCERGERSLGPLVYRTDHRDHATFSIGGDFIRFSGFRLKGPGMEYFNELTLNREDETDKGIAILPISLDPVRECELVVLCSVEIDNMEIFEWEREGVGVKDLQGPKDSGLERGRLREEYVGSVHIHDSFIHDNAGTSKGYGVNVGNGAYALIERNVFDGNRHAIAGGSRPRGGSEPYDYSGYTARENLVLGAGGVHCPRAGGCWQTHQFDMHGTESPWYSGDFSCGKAGETIIIERNTFFYNEAIKIRGNPTGRAVVDGNIFYDTRGRAVRQNGDCGISFFDKVTNPVQVLPNNVFAPSDVTPAQVLVLGPLLGMDPGYYKVGTYGKCDFVGDGGIDEFMATGVTWWTRSAATNQWRYLNTMPQYLGALDLVDVDGDGVCDARRADSESSSTSSNPFARGPFYSKSGTGPWQRLSPIPEGPDIAGRAG
jgi:hypothetical protein